MAWCRHMFINCLICCLHRALKKAAVSRIWTTDSFRGAKLSEICTTGLTCPPTSNLLCNLSCTQGTRHRARLNGWPFWEPPRPWRQTWSPENSEAMAIAKAPFSLADYFRRAIINQWITFFRRFCDKWTNRTFRVPKIPKTYRLSLSNELLIFYRPSFVASSMKGFSDSGQ